MALMPFEALVGGHALRRVHQDDIIQWAQDALEAGIDTPSLRETAGAVSSMGWSHFEALLQRLKSELQVNSRSAHELTMAYAKWIAESILESAIDEVQGCQELQRVSVASGYPERLSVWMMLDAEVAGLGSWLQTSEEVWRAAVRAEARTLLESASDS